MFRGGGSEGELDLVPLANQARCRNPWRRVRRKKQECSILHVLAIRLEHAGTCARLGKRRAASEVETGGAARPRPSASAAVAFITMFTSAFTSAALPKAR
jgi:hypothetical protein